MPKFNPPEAMDFSHPETWPDWKDRFILYRMATKLHKEDGEIQVSSLVYAMGREASKIFKSFTFDEPTEEIPDPANHFETVLAKFENYFIPKRNIIHERTKFHQRNQAPGESIEMFLRSLHDLARNCSFGENENENIRDKFIAGLSDPELSQKLQVEQEDFTLQKAISYARQWEMVKQQNRSVETSVNAATWKTSARPTRERNNRETKESQNQTEMTDKCGKCGYTHRSKRPDACPARRARCHRCNKVGHFESVCFSKKVHEVNESAPDEWFLGTVSCDDTDPPWKVKLSIAGKLIEFKIDSGADTSVICEEVYNSFSPKPKLVPIKSSLIGVGGPLICKGQFVAHTNVKEQDYSFRIVVVKSKVASLLSRSVASQMGLIVKVDEFEEVFGDIGCLNTEPVQIILQDGAEPYALSVARRIPIPLESKVKEELDRLQVAGVIEPITKPTAWCAPMVPVLKKSGKVRLCVDLKKLNKAVQREKFILPTLQDVTSKLSGARVFTSLDAASGFYQIPLDKNSQELTTFITPFGRYCFRRLPFGITSAPEIFMRKMSQLFEGVEGVFCYMDDILIYGKDMKEHDERLSAVMNIVISSGLKLNESKCLFRQPELKFLGHTFTANGVVADPDKVTAILGIPAPTNVASLRQFMGMIHYLGSYLPDLHNVTRPLNDLLKGDAAWSWGPDQESAFIKVKEMVSSTPVLAYYDATKPTCVSADASSYGVGGVILQDQGGGCMKPVAFCSRMLTPTEQRYAQIEKECLASVWTCEKFDRYLCGLTNFKLLTDHKPLVPLINTKDLDNTPLRCQRMLMRLMRYKAVAEYAPGKTLVVADALSRSPMSETKSSILEQDIELYVQMIDSCLPMSTQRKEELQTCTRNDAILQSAIVFTLTGWPKYEKDVPDNLKQFFNVKELLSVSNGLLTYADRIVIPKDMQPEILDRIHDGHQGVVKCQERAKLSVWWPGISRDIKSIVAMCDHCQTYKPKQHKEPLMTTPLPSAPWQKIAIDLCMNNGQNYLIVVDYYSRWIEILHVSITTSSACIAKLKDVFSRFGIPSELISDNGPQFVSSEFKLFVDKYCFNHITTSPHLPSANGEAERAVQTAKRILRQEDPWLALMIYRDTVISATGCSPSQLMLGRHIRTTLPTLPSALKPSLPNPDKVRARDLQTKLSYERQYNRRNGVIALSPLQPGNAVRMRTDLEKKWDKNGVVSHNADTPRSYIVRADDGAEYRRNRRHLQLTPQDARTSPTKDQSSPRAKPAEQPVPDRSLSSEMPAEQPVPLRRSCRNIKVPERLIEQI